jgi:two-component system, LuxR family, response regulator FixJ
MTMTDATVFIIDDDPSVRKSLLRVIRFGGWDGEAFASAQEFLARPTFSGTGCVILDVRMPGMMGPELCSVMAARNIALPVIFLTGSADIPEGIETWNEGVVDFLVKPVGAKALLQAIRQALERHAGSTEPETPARFSHQISLG